MKLRDFQSSQEGESKNTYDLKTANIRVVMVFAWDVVDPKVQILLVPILRVGFGPLSAMFAMTALTIRSLVSSL